MEFLKAEFISRPNRYLIHALLNGEIVKAHCPNPGRMTELLFPGIVIYLIKADSANTQRKTEYTAEALEYNKQIVPIHSVKANEFAKNLLIPKYFPEALKVKSEFSIGKSRFDFLVIENDKKTLVEVKACTLIYNNTAMFPDAPTKRGTKHVTELAELTEQGYSGMVLILIMHGNASVFRANIHTDPIFAAALYKNKDILQIKAANIVMDKTGNAAAANYSVPINHSLSQISNSGVYAIIIQLEEKLTIKLKEEIILESGYYVYTGSAKKNLTQRINRHKRKKKKEHWHIDKLTTKGKVIKNFPIHTLKDLECSLSSDISNTSDKSIFGFGCTDCRCRSHLFYYSDNPLKNREFINVILEYRHTKC